MTERNNYLYWLYQSLMGSFRVHVKQAIFLHRNFLTAHRTEVAQHGTLLELAGAAVWGLDSCTRETGTSELGEHTSASSR